MKTDYLVLYDYGQGGVWAIVRARSVGDIRLKYPQLEVFLEKPEWMEDETLAAIRNKMSFDIDAPSGFLESL